MNNEVLNVKIDTSQLIQLQRNIAEYSKWAGKSQKDVGAKYSYEMSWNLGNLTREKAITPEAFKAVPLAKGYKIKRFVGGKPKVGGVDYKFYKWRVADIMEARSKRRFSAAIGWYSIAKRLKKGLQAGKMGKTGAVTVHIQDNQTTITISNFTIGARRILTKFGLLQTAILQTMANADVYIRRKMIEKANSIF